LRRSGASSRHGEIQGCLDLLSERRAGGCGGGTALAGQGKAHPVELPGPEEKGAAGQDRASQPMTFDCSRKSRGIMHIQNNRLPRRGPLAVALATGLVMGGQASAQDPQEPQAGATLFPATELDRIVVTARKREESILEVPMNISVIGAT